MSSDPPGVRPPMLKSMDEAMRERMHLLLKSIMKLNHARAHFNVPVDWKKLKLLQYPEIIKDPMDLGMVEKKLEADRHEPFARKHYQLAEEFAHDVRLVWKNALVFNYTTSSPVYKSAKALAEIFEDKLAKAYRRSEMLGPPCPLKTRCQLLLSDIRRNPLSEWYRRAADWKIFGPSYVQGLSSGEPMDLDQVQRRLAQGDYDVAVDGGAPVFKADAFARDMGLIWRNAMEFNKEGVFWLCPKILKDTFDRRQEMLLGAPVPRERGKRREERDGWPSFERKRDLARKCSRLLAMEGNDVARLIRNSCAGAITVDEVHGVQQAVVELDKVDEATFAKAEGMLRSKTGAAKAAGATGGAPG